MCHTTVSLFICKQLFTRCVSAFFNLIIFCLAMELCINAIILSLFAFLVRQCQHNWSTFLYMHSVVRFECLCTYTCFLFQEDGWHKKQNNAHTDWYANIHTCGYLHAHGKIDAENRKKERKIARGQGTMDYRRISSCLTARWQCIINLAILYPYNPVHGLSRTLTIFISFIHTVLCHFTVYKPHCFQFANFLPKHTCRHARLLTGKKKNFFSS